MDIRIAWVVVVRCLFIHATNAYAKTDEDATETALNVGAPPLLGAPEPGKCFLITRGY